MLLAFFGIKPKSSSTKAGETGKSATVRTVETAKGGTRKTIVTSSSKLSTPGKIFSSSSKGDDGSSHSSSKKHRRPPPVTPIRSASVRSSVSGSAFSDTSERSSDRESNTSSRRSASSTPVKVTKKDSVIIEHMPASVFCTKMETSAETARRLAAFRTHAEERDLHFKAQAMMNGAVDGLVDRLFEHYLDLIIRKLAPEFEQEQRKAETQKIATLTRRLSIAVVAHPVEMLHNRDHSFHLGRAADGPGQLGQQGGKEYVRSPSPGSSAARITGPGGEDGSQYPLHKPSPQLQQDMPPASPSSAVGRANPLAVPRASCRRGLSGASTISLTAPSTQASTTTISTVTDGPEDGCNIHDSLDSAEGGGCS